MNAADIERVEASGISVKQLVAIIAMQNELARSSIGFENVMLMVAERAMALTTATGGVVELVDGDAMAYRAACGSLSEFTGLRIPRTGSLAGLCIEHGVALSSADTSSDPRVDRAACARVGAVSMVCVPLFFAGAAVGVLKVVSDQPRAFDPANEATVALLADVIAAAMLQAREYDAAVTLSLHDGLTGLPNRRAFDRQLMQEIGRSVRHGHALSVAMFDLDGLKAANDTQGHAAGDAILCGAARVLRQALRAHDGCFRLGGDEFAAILPETSSDSARQAIARCCASLAAAGLGNGKVGMSAGVAELVAGESAEALVARADAALYEHKSRNRDGSRGAMAMSSTQIERFGR